MRQPVFILPIFKVGEDFGKLSTRSGRVNPNLEVRQPVFILPIFKVGEDFGKLSTRSGRV